MCIANFSCLIDFLDDYWTVTVDLLIVTDGEGAVVDTRRYHNNKYRELCHFIL